MSDPCRSEAVGVGAAVCTGHRGDARPDWGPRPGSNWWAYGSERMQAGGLKGVHAYKLRAQRRRSLTGSIDRGADGRQIPQT